MIGKPEFRLRLAASGAAAVLAVLLAIWAGPAAGGWLSSSSANGVRSAGSDFKTLKKYARNLAGSADKAFDGVFEDDSGKVDDVWKEAEKATDELILDHVPVPRVALDAPGRIRQRLQAAGHHVKSRIGIGDVRSALAISRDEKKGYAAEGIMGGKPLPSPRSEPKAAPAPSVVLADARRRVEEYERLVEEHRRLAEEGGEAVARRWQAGTRFRDCDECPELVVVPAGSFKMGLPGSEAERDDDEGPLHRVRIERPFAVGVYEVTFAEWDACVSGGGCGGYSPEDEGWGRGSRPVINVNWDDARAYVRWLSEKTEKAYRLLSESEWEYVAREGTKKGRYQGKSASEQCRYENGPDRADCNDGHVYTSPVGSYRKNKYGLYDVLGNVSEWVEDCWNESYRGAPEDGSAWEFGNCSRRVLRGGSWSGGPRNLRSAGRGRDDSGDRFGGYGFRIARTLTP